MSVQIPNHFVTKYDSDVRLVAQQTMSRLQGAVTPHPGIVGSSKAVDRYGATESQQVVDRHGDTQIVDTPHLRRFIDLQDFDWADYVDGADKLKVLADPSNRYVQGAVAAHNRRKDRLIIGALGGNARKHDNSLVALPAGQKVLHGGTNISMAKIRTAIEIMNANEADSPEEGGERHIAITSKQLTVLMADSTLTSADYNTLRALQNYTLGDNLFMGLRWHRLELLPLAAGIRSCYLWGKSYVALGLGYDIKNRIAERPDKRHLIQVYSSMSLGAVRVEDEGVVEIQCQE